MTSLVRHGFDLSYDSCWEDLPIYSITLDRLYFPLHVFTKQYRATLNLLYEIWNWIVAKSCTERFAQNALNATEFNFCTCADNVIVLTMYTRHLQKHNIVIDIWFYCLLLLHFAPHHSPLYTLTLSSLN